MKITYEEMSLSAETLEVIEIANRIIRIYQNNGYDLTLRQLYYQLVARDYIPNDMRSYKRLGSIISKGRRAGLIDWAVIVDRTRNVKRNSHWESPREILEAATNGYYRDRWMTQDYKPEVWIEKDALIGVIENVCSQLDVSFFACRGYVSDSEMWRAGQRIASVADDKETIIFHLGDHDPSGIDMTRDIQERLTLFSGIDVDVRRIALTMEQIDLYKPPPNPAKITDSRSDEYIRRYGRNSWELDALEPAVLRDLIQENIEPLIDTFRWEYVEEIEKEHKQKLLALSYQLDD